MSEEQLTALQDVLASVHSMIWAYGEIGAHVSAVHLQAVQDADNRTRGTRGAIEDTIRALGGEPVPSSAGYRLPTLLTDDAAAIGLAASLEQSLTQHWRYALGAPGPKDNGYRELCVDGLTTASRAALTWQRLLDPNAVPAALPGLS